MYTYLCKSVLKKTSHCIKLFVPTKLALTQPTSVLSSLPKAPWDSQKRLLPKLCGQQIPTELAPHHSLRPPRSNAQESQPWGRGSRGSLMCENRPGLLCALDEII